MSLAFFFEPSCCSGNKPVGRMRDHVEKNWVSSASWTCGKAQPGSAKPPSCPQKHVRTLLNSAQIIRYAQLTHRLVIKNNCLLLYAIEVLFLFVMQRKVADDSSDNCTDIANEGGFFWAEGPLKFQVPELTARLALSSVYLSPRGRPFSFVKSS